MHKCNPTHITITTERHHRIPAQATRIVHASITANLYHLICRNIQHLPQFHECIKLIIASAIATATDKRVTIKIANTTDFPHTLTPKTKLAEVQILTSHGTNSIRPVDITALSLLTSHDDLVK